MEQIMQLSYALDTFYFLMSGALVMWMAAGFTMLEAGLVRAKNTAEILTKNVGLYSIACLMYMLCGYGIMYGDGSGIIPGFGMLGTADNAVAEVVAGGDDAPYYSSLSDFFFQVVFVATAMSIVSGAVAERMKLWSFFAFAVVMTAVIYPVQGYWTWGGGFLGEAFGYSDYAGSGIVHLAGAAAALAGVALARQADARAVVDPGGDLQVQGAGLTHLAVAVAGGAGIGDHLAGAVAAGAGALDLEEAVGLAHAARAVAGGAGDGLGARLGPRTLAGLAGQGGGHVDLDFGPAIGLLQRNLQVVAQVRTAARSALLAPALAAAESVPEGVAEDLGEDVVQIGEALALTEGIAAPAAVDPGVAEPVIGRPLLVVGQNRIGLGNLLELGHGLFRAAVPVRVMDHRQLAIGRFQAGGVDRPLDAQNFVIVTRHRASVLITSPAARPEPLRALEKAVSRLTWGPARLMQVS